MPEPDLGVDVVGGAMSRAGTCNVISGRFTRDLMVPRAPLLTAWPGPALLAGASGWDHTGGTEGVLAVWILPYPVLGERQ